MVRDVALVALGGVIGGWLGAACAAVLLAIWRIVPRTEGPPVLQVCLSTQWTQVSIGVYHTAFFHRQLDATLKSDYQPMVLISLGALLALAIGIRIGSQFIASRVPRPLITPEYCCSLQTLMVIYVTAVFVTGVLQEIAFQYPTLTQIILAFSLARLALIYLLLRRLSMPVLRWPLIAAVLVFEIVLGFTGYFSSFKEPMILAALAMLETFDAKKLQHWVTMAVMTVALGFLLLMWINVRGEFRQDFDDEAFAASRSARIDRMEALSTDWLNTTDRSNVMEQLDVLVDRVWAIYYPALAVERVPAVIPHTNGELMKSVLIHLFTPRILFPNKPDLPSDSDFVRKYSGTYVAGLEEGTSIAFGYVAESYVDFGVPLMYGPLFALGLLIGGLYAWFLNSIAHRELAIALVCSTFLINFYMYERSWAKLVGLLLTMLAYVGLVAWLLDRWLLLKYENAPPAAALDDHMPYGEHLPGH